MQDGGRPQGGQFPVGEPEAFPYPQGEILDAMAVAAQEGKTHLECGGERPQDGGGKRFYVFAEGDPLGKNRCDFSGHGRKRCQIVPCERLVSLFVRQVKDSQNTPVFEKRDGEKRVAFVPVMLPLHPDREIRLSGDEQRLLFFRDPGSHCT